MRYLTIAALLALVTPAFSYTRMYTVSLDVTYDRGQNSLYKVACSNGEHGLLTAGYTTFDSLPTFPFIGGVPQIMSWNSHYCGTCWELTYTNPRGVSTSVNITAINTVDDGHEGFIISRDAMDILTGGSVGGSGSVQATIARVPKKACGMKF